MIGDKPKEQKIHVNMNDLIPEIESVHTGGLIVIKNSNGLREEINVEKFLERFSAQMKKESAGDNINNEDEIKIEESKILESRKVLTDKIDLLKDIINAYEQIIKTQEQYPENYYHNQNILNIADFIEKEKEALIDKKDNNNNKTYKIEDAIKEIETKREKEDDIIEELNKYGILLDNEIINRNELNLILRVSNKKCYAQLKDEGFQLLSQITFKNLIGLNLANNEIKDISPLDDMLLPHLETIDLSDNLIENIFPVANLVSEYLADIYLQNNKIKDLGPFLNSNFGYLTFLRVDGNGEAFKKNSFKAVIKKYGNKIMYELKKWDYFASKYNFYLNDKKDDLNAQDYLNQEKFDLGSRRNGEILRDLFPLIISPNRIKCLILDDNKLEDVSLLRIMPLFNLEELDLSLNFITSIKFFKRMTNKWKRLQKLYLNDNKINDISPFEKYNDGEKEKEKEKKFPSSLTILSLKNNCLDLNDSITRNILDKLINSNLTFDYGMKNLNPEENNERGTKGNTQ